MSDPELTCRLTADLGEVEAHHRIRHRVFVEEQELFESTDHDEQDEDPAVRHVLGFVGDVPAGTVRLYRIPSLDPDERLWKGDRLAVLPEFRHSGLGAPLVRYAVSTAGVAGGDRMIAYIQPSNVVLFERLGWHQQGEPSDYLGSLHQQMWIGLR